MKRLSLFGSTGSIGKQTLEIVRNHPDEFSILALASSGNHLPLLEQQVREFHPDFIVIDDVEKAHRFHVKNPFVQVVAGEEGLLAMADADVDLCVMAIAGSRGLLPTYRALKKGVNVALATKEVLVASGELILKTAKENGATVLPIDSEHSALFQCLQGREGEVSSLILTSSGGPFWKYSKEEMQKVTVEEALKHPTWKMGPKVTVDSSTLMNKGLEVIEAHFLFGIPSEKIEVVIHPQSILHGAIELIDGQNLALLSPPNMCYPIQYALSYPKRLPIHLPPFSWRQTLEFYPYEPQKFPSVKLAKEALSEGGSFSCFLNAANEALVHRFLAREIPWSGILEKLEKLLSLHKREKLESIEQVVSLEERAKSEAKKA